MVSQERLDALRDKVQNVSAVFERVRAPGKTIGELAEAMDFLNITFNLRDADLRRMRDSAVEAYDAKRAERAAQGLEPLQWSRDDLMPEAGTLDHALINIAEFMRGLNREILKRQAAANRPPE